MAALPNPDIKSSSSRKRQSSQSLDHPIPKLQKNDHPSFPPEIFWDQLSKIPLTKNALRELERRTALQPPCNSVTDQDTAQRVASRTLSPSLLRRIKRFARHGGPDLSKLRGHHQIPSIPQEIMDSSQSKLDPHERNSQAPDTTVVTTTRKTSPYDRAFVQHLIDHHIFSEGYKYPDGRLPPEPSNMDAILEALGRPRASLSTSTISTTDFHEFREMNVHATNQKEVITSVIPMIEGNTADRKCIAGGIPLTNLDHLTNGTLVAGHPDLFYGARPEQLDSEIRIQLHGQVIPSTQHDLPITPNFFLQVKGPGGGMDVGIQQACYNGALGARAMHSLQSYGQSTPIYNNNAYTLTAIYCYGMLRMFTVHPLPPESDHPPGFVMTHINSWCMIGNRESFLQGATALRNGLDWAKQQRDKVIARANTIVANGNTVK